MLGRDGGGRRDRRRRDGEARRGPAARRASAAASSASLQSGGVVAIAGSGASSRGAVAVRRPWRAWRWRRQSALYVRAGRRSDDGWRAGGERRRFRRSTSRLPSAERGAGPSPRGGVEVDEIDAPSHGVSVFEIPAAAAAAVANPRAPSSVVVMGRDEPGRSDALRPRDMRRPLAAVAVAAAAAGGRTALAAARRRARHRAHRHPRHAVGRRGLRSTRCSATCRSSAATQPFVDYNVYKLLERKALPLEASKPVGVASSSNGRVLQVTLVELAGDADGQALPARAADRRAGQEGLPEAARGHRERERALLRRRSELRGRDALPRAGRSPRRHGLAAVPRAAFSPRRGPLW